MGQIDGAHLLQHPRTLQGRQELFQRLQPLLLALGDRHLLPRPGGQDGQPSHRDGAGVLPGLLQQLARRVDEPRDRGRGPLLLRGSRGFAGGVLPRLVPRLLPAGLLRGLRVGIDLHLGGGGPLLHGEGQGAGQAALHRHVPDVGQLLPDALRHLVLVHTEQVVPYRHAGGCDDLLRRVAAAAHHRDGLHLEEHRSPHRQGGRQGRPAQQLEQQAHPTPAVLSFSVVSR